MIQEHELVPYSVDPLPPGPYLVFAPHPDDETFGMGGLIALAAESGVSVHIVMLTDGRMGGDVEERKNETREAVRILGASCIEFWDYPDRGLHDSVIPDERFRDVMERVTPGTVFAPTFQEIHPDHRAAGRKVGNYLFKSGYKGLIWLYEINRTAEANRLIDITPVLEKKISAIRAYRSQLAQIDYESMNLCMNRNRSLTLPREMTHAEGFWQTFPATAGASFQEDYRKGILRYFEPEKDAASIDEINALKNDLGKIRKSAYLKYFNSAYEARLIHDAYREKLSQAAGAIRTLAANSAPERSSAHVSDIRPFSPENKLPAMISYRFDPVYRDTAGRQCEERPSALFLSSMQRLTPHPVLPDTPHRFVLPGGAKSLNGISLQIGTYCRVNTCRLTVSVMTAEGEALRRVTRPAYEFTDNTLEDFFFDAVDAPNGAVIEAASSDADDFNCVCLWYGDSVELSKGVTAITERPDEHQDIISLLTRKGIRISDFNPETSFHIKDRFDRYDILVVDQHLPAHDRDSGAKRMTLILKMMTELGYNVSFYPENGRADSPYREMLERMGVEVLGGRPDMGEILCRNYRFAFLCRFNTALRYAGFFRTFSPDTLLLFDTVDIHYLREMREAETKGDTRIKREAERTKKAELAAALLCDNVIAVTEEDGLAIVKELPNIHIDIVPNIHGRHLLENDSCEPLGFTQRSGIGFLGNFEHSPNVDAVSYFLETMWPEITKTLGARFFIIGNNPPEALRARGGDDIVVTGYVPDISRYMTELKVFVCPLRFGAGMKGKIGEAMTFSLPVVSTPIGLEGMGITHGKEALCAAVPDDFIRSVISIYNDEGLWKKLSEAGRRYIDRTLGYTIVKSKLSGILKQHTET